MFFTLAPPPPSPGQYFCSAALQAVGPGGGGRGGGCGVISQDASLPVRKAQTAPLLTPSTVVVSTRHS